MEMTTPEALEIVERLNNILGNAAGGPDPATLEQVWQLCASLESSRIPGSPYIGDKLLRIRECAETIFSHRKWNMFEAPDSPRAGWEVCRQLAMNDISVLRRIIKAGIEGEREANVNTMRFLGGNGRGWIATEVRVGVAARAEGGSPPRPVPIITLRCPSTGDEVTAKSSKSFLKMDEIDLHELLQRALKERGHG